jgi:enamine deaminase RidA (YjgF/YER057c/UK114 family)
MGELMQLSRGVALGVALVLGLSLLSGAQKKRKKKGGEEEEITQTLPLLKDPPLAVTADTERVSFRVSPLSAKGLLSPQVREALKALLQTSRGASIVKLRAFVAGTGDVRRVQTIVSEVFTERRLALPTLTVVQVGGLPLEGAQVVIESTGVEKKAVNPQGLAFLSGQPGESATDSVERLGRTLSGIGITGSRVLRATCFLSALDVAGETRTVLAGAFPNAAVDLVQMQRVPVRPPCECEVVAALERPVEGTVRFGDGYTLVASPRIALSGLQMAFHEEESDVRLAFERLGRTLDTQGTGLKEVVAASVYVLDGGAAAAFRKVRPDFLTSANPPALSLLPFESLPSVDASLGMDVVAAVRK